MSTNYYARTPDTAPDSDGLHIGQHSTGWEFLFRAHSENGLTSSDAWREYLSRDGVTIVTEYGTSVVFSTFWAQATKRPADLGAGGHHLMRSRLTGFRREVRDGTAWQDERGCPFYAGEFL